jgi:8-oxo-dGTP pyrophosphatase MutT (NUDIX family)
MWNTRGRESSKRLGSWEIPDTVSAMAREISAGGVVLRQISGVWNVALIEPQKSEPLNETSKSSPKRVRIPRKRSRAVLGLPKGLVDVGEKAETAAIREVREETGLVAVPVMKLSDNKYVYVRTWGDGERVFKIVSFYLMRYVSGEIDDIAADMRVEVRQALWVPLADAASLLAHSNERKVLRQAEEQLAKLA